jgi:hypothetical protein
LTVDPIATIPDVAIADVLPRPRLIAKCMFVTVVHFDCTRIDWFRADHTTPASLTIAEKLVQSRIGARRLILAWIRLTVIYIFSTIFAAPTFLTHAFEAIDRHFVHTVDSPV